MLGEICGALSHDHVRQYFDPHTRLYALPAWGILVVGSEEKTIVARDQLRASDCLCKRFGGR